jgi:23S rRNA (uracil1939-C5)-methyltransferase
MKMRKNEELELIIHDLHANGHGVGKNAGGIAVFVSGALPGDRIRAKLLKVKKQYAYGKIEEIITPSPQRLQKSGPNICPAASKCGGCQFQNFDYRAQLLFKEKLVKDALARIGGYETPPVSSILGMDKPYQYRNKAQFPVGGDGKRPLIGFYAPRSHRIVPIDDCNIQHPTCGIVLRAVKKMLKQRPISIYNEETHKGLLRHVIVRTGFNTGETMIIFVINGNTIPNFKAEEFSDLLGSMPFTLLTNKNTARTNVILGSKFTVLQGSGYIHEEIGHIRYRISPPAFFQVNPVQARVLYDVIASRLQGSDKVIDAYSGIGGITLYVAGKVQKVVAVESLENAAADGKYNASLNGIENAGFLCGAAEDLVPKLLEQKIYDTLILDPPRKGCDAKLLEAVIAGGIPKIIYVSCDPATLARDIKQLAAGGYRLAHVQPVDLFPMTGHVETVSLLLKNIL